MSWSPGARLSAELPAPITPERDHEPLLREKEVNLSSESDEEEQEKRQVVAPANVKRERSPCAADLAHGAHTAKREAPSGEAACQPEGQELLLPSPAKVSDAAPGELTQKAEVPQPEAEELPIDAAAAAAVAAAVVQVRGALVWPVRVVYESYWGPAQVNRSQGFHVTGHWLPDFNGLYRHKGAVAGWPYFVNGADKHLFRVVSCKRWQLGDKISFVNASTFSEKLRTVGDGYIEAVAGPLPTGERPWTLLQAGEGAAEPQLVVQQLRSRNWCNPD